MIRIPSVPQLAQTNISMPQVDPSSKIRQLQAIGDLGQSIAGLGEAYAKHAQQAQEMEDDKNISEMRQNLRMDLQKHQQELVTNGDPDKYVSSTRDFLSARRKLLDEKPMTAGARHRAELEFDSIATDATLSAGDLAFRKTREGLIQNSSNEIAEAKKNGDEQSLKQAHETLSKYGLSSEELFHSDLNEMFENVRNGQMMSAAVNSPKEFISNNPLAKDPVERKKQEPYVFAARKSYVQDTASSLVSLFDGIRNNTYTTPEGLSKAAPQLSEGSLKVAHDALERHQSTSGDVELSPDEVNGLIGDFTDGLKRFRINKENSDQAFASLAGILDRMPDNETRRMLSQELHQLYQENTEYTKTREQKAYDLVKNVDPKDLGYIDTYKTPVSKLVADGLLRDSKKLAMAGLDSDQVRKVMEPNARFDEDGNQVLIPSSDEERLARFKEYFDPKKLNPDAPLQVRRAFEGLHSGEDQVSLLSESQEKKIQEQNRQVKIMIGDSANRLIQFAREHPKDDLNEEYENIMMDLSRQKAILTGKK